jgi:hypothetical protein
LKIYSKLKTTTKIKPISKKQKLINENWAKITDQKFEETGRICLWCEKPGERNGNNPIHGHHIKRRNGHNNTLDNCYPCHDFVCHTEITDKNIDVTVYKNKKEWENRDKGVNK